MKNSYVVELEEDEFGYLILPIPDEVLKELDWKEGDDLDFSLRDGTVILQKVYDAEQQVYDMGWKHFCPIEKFYITTAHNQECNWCGAREDSYIGVE